MDGDEMVAAEDLNHRRGELMRGVRKRGDQFAVGFRGRPFAAVLPFSQLQEERAELEQLRRRVAELETAVQDQPKGTAA